MSPSSSPMIEKMKSLSAWGTQLHFCRLLPSPSPNQPPEPIAICPCAAWYPDPWALPQTSSQPSMRAER